MDSEMRTAASRSAAMALAALSQGAMMHAQDSSGESSGELLKVLRGYLPVLRESMREPLPDLLSLKEAQARLGISRNALYNQINAGALKSVRLGNLRRIRRDDYLEFIKNLPCGEDQQ